MASESWLFGSFFLGGFECSTHLTLEGQRLDLIAATQHDTQAADDYGRCRAAGIRAVREAARWPIIDRGGTLDLDGVRHLARLGQAAGLTLIWDLMHYGYPDDLDPFAPAFAARFAAYARAVAVVVRDETAPPHYYTPINEISYNAWAGAAVGYMAPFAKGRGGDLKCALVGAAIAGSDAIWAVDPEARLVNVDPLVRIHPPAGRLDLQAEADHFNRYVVTEAFDLLAGRLEPELGGSRAHLGIIGLNYYAGNQWTIPTPEQPQQFLHPADPRWTPLPDLLADLQDRYGGPLIIAETGAAGEGRAEWLNHLAADAARALARGVDLQGICWYPLVTSPDWEDPTAFFDGGLFDVVPQPDGRIARTLAIPVAVALRAAQAALDPANMPRDSLPLVPPAAPQAPLAIARPLVAPRVKSDNFACVTLCAGDSLVLEVYTFGPGGGVPPHRHETTEHILTVLRGAGHMRIGAQEIELNAGESVLAPAGLYHTIWNTSTELLVVQQVSAPKPWDARFGGPRPRGAREPSAGPARPTNAAPDRDGQPGATRRRSRGRRRGGRGRRRSRPE